MANFQLTQNGQQVQRDLNLIEAGLASEYSALSTYSVGDIVVYTDKVYKCTTVVSEPEVFDSNKWTQTTVAAVLAEKLSSVKVVNINSETATQGQVLTADGSGGASWQNASGEKVYMHNISLHSANGTLINCVIYTESSTPFTGITLILFLYNLYSNSVFNYLPANGILVLTNSDNVVLGIKATTDKLRIYYAYPSLNVDFANETASLQFNQYSIDYNASSFTVDDAVVEA